MSSYVLSKPSYKGSQGDTLKIIKRAPKPTSKLKPWHVRITKPYSGKNANPRLEHLPKITSALIGSFYWGKHQDVMEWDMPDHWHLAKVPGEPFKIKVSIGLSLGEEPFRRYERIVDIKQSGGIAKASLYICPTCKLGSRYLFISVHKEGEPLECCHCTNCVRVYAAMHCETKSNPLKSDRPFKRYWHMANKYLAGRMPDGELPAPANCEWSVEFTAMMRKQYKSRTLCCLKRAVDVVIAPLMDETFLKPKKRLRKPKSSST